MPIDARHSHMYTYTLESLAFDWLIHTDRAIRLDWIIHTDRFINID